MKTHFLRKHEYKSNIELFVEATKIHNSYLIEYDSTIEKEIQLVQYLIKSVNKSSCTYLIYITLGIAYSLNFYNEITTIATMLGLDYICNECTEELKKC